MGMTEQQSIAPTVEDNSQQLKGMDGSTAWHLIGRHADNWADVGKMMDEWLKANTEASIATPATEQANTSHEDTERLNYLLKTGQVVLEVNGEYFTYNHTSGRSGPSMATPRAAIDASIDDANNKPATLICPRCGVDRFKHPCPGPLHMCPIRGDAQGAA